MAVLREHHILFMSYVTTSKEISGTEDYFTYNVFGDIIYFFTGVSFKQ
jgi:hypothetical protein